MNRRQKRSPRTSDGEAQTSGVPHAILPEWEAETKRLRKAANARQELAMKVCIPAGLGLLFFGFGIFLGPFLLGGLGISQWIFGGCFAMAFVSGFIMAAALVVHETAKAQTKDRFVLSGPSLGYYNNRSLFSNGPDRLAVRVRLLHLAACGLFMAASVPFFVVAVAAFQEPTRVIRTSRGRKGPPALFMGIAMGTGGLAFFSVGSLMIAFARRIDFDRKRKTFRVWDWTGGRTLPLAMIRAVECRSETATSSNRRGRQKTHHYQAVNLILADKRKSRLHVMNTVPGDAQSPWALAEWLGLSVVGSAAPPSHVQAKGRRLPSLRIQQAALLVAVSLMTCVSYAAFRRLYPAPPPPPDVGALARLEGYWKGERQTAGGRTLAIERSGRRVLSGRFVEVIEVQRDQQTNEVLGKSVIYWRYDSPAKTYSGLRLASRGPVSRMEAQWQERAKELRAETLDGNTRLTVKFDDDGRYSETLNGTAIRSVLHKSSSNERDVLEQAWANEDSARVLRPGEYFFARRIGTWNERLRLARGTRLGNFRLTNRWALGGRFLRMDRAAAARDSRSPSPALRAPLTQLAYCRFDRKREQHRMWVLQANGRISYLEGKPLHAQVVQWKGRGDDGLAARSSWHYAGADAMNTEWQFGKRPEDFHMAHLTRDRRGPVAAIRFQPPPLHKATPPQRRHKTPDANTRRLDPPSGPNLTVSARAKDSGGIEPANAFDGDRQTVWRGGLGLFAEWGDPRTIGRLVIVQRGDRILSCRVFAIVPGSRKPVRLVTVGPYESAFPKLEKDAGAPSAGTVEVNGRPLAEHLQEHLLGASKQDVVIDIRLPNPVAATTLRLAIVSATAAPVEIAEFEAYAN